MGERVHCNRSSYQIALTHLTISSMNVLSSAFPVGFMKYLIAALALVAFGCGGSPTKPDAKSSAPKTASVTTDNRDNASIRYDINGDKMPDVWKYRQRIDGKDVLVRKEFDVNFDGKVDIWRNYHPDGTRDYDQMDMDFDGKVDVTTFYEDDKVVRKEIDLEFDEKPDVIKYFNAGELTRVEGDSDNDGRVDYWEYYKNGKLSRVGTDEDGDGAPDPDKWHEEG